MDPVGIPGVETFIDKRGLGWASSLCFWPNSKCPVERAAQPWPCIPTAPETRLGPVSGAGGVVQHQPVKIVFLQRDWGRGRGMGVGRERKGRTCEPGPELRALPGRAWGGLELRDGPPAWAHLGLVLLDEGVGPVGILQLG